MHLPHLRDVPSGLLYRCSWMPVPAGAYCYTYILTVRVSTMAPSWSSYPALVDDDDHHRSRCCGDERRSARCGHGHVSCRAGRLGEFRDSRDEEVPQAGRIMDHDQWHTISETTRTVTGKPSGARRPLEKPPGENHTTTGRQCTDGRPSIRAASTRGGIRENKERTLQLAAM